MHDAESEPSWRRQASAIIDALYEAAIQAKDGEDWLAAWWPSMVAARNLGATLFSLLARLRGILADGEPVEFDIDAATEIRERIEELGDSFPEAGHLFDGLEIVDAMMQHVIDNDEVRGQAVQLFRALESMGDALIARVLSVWMNPDSLEIAPHDFEIYLSRLEDLLRVFMDTLIDRSLRD